MPTSGLCVCTGTEKEKDMSCHGRLPTCRITLPGLASELCQVRGASQSNGCAVGLDETWGSWKRRGLGLVVQNCMQLRWRNVGVGGGATGEAWLPGSLRRSCSVAEFLPLQWEEGREGQVGWEGFQWNVEQAIPGREQPGARLGNVACGWVQFRPRAGLEDRDGSYRGLWSRNGSLF